VPTRPRRGPTRCRGSPGLGQAGSCRTSGERLGPAVDSSPLRRTTGSGEKALRRESVPDNRNNDSSNLLGVGTGVTDEQATFQVTSRVGKPNTGGAWVELDRPQKFPRREVIHWLFLSRCHSMHRDCPLLSVAEPPPPHRRRGGGGVGFGGWPRGDRLRQLRLHGASVAVCGHRCDYVGRTRKSPEPWNETQNLCAATGPALCIFAIST
jgi:hypothetical protein